jgi:hypothetical protein
MPKGKLQNEVKGNCTKEKYLSYIMHHIKEKLSS